MSQSQLMCHDQEMNRTCTQHTLMGCVLDSENKIVCSVSNSVSLCIMYQPFTGNRLEQPRMVIESSLNVGSAGGGDEVVWTPLLLATTVFTLPCSGFVFTVHKLLQYNYNAHGMALL